MVLYRILPYHTRSLPPTSLSRQTFASSYSHPPFSSTGPQAPRKKMPKTPRARSKATASYNPLPQKHTEAGTKTVRSLSSRTSSTITLMQPLLGPADHTKTHNPPPENHQRHPHPPRTRPPSHFRNPKNRKTNTFRAAHELPHHHLLHQNHQTSKIPPRQPHQPPKPPRSAP